MMDQKTLAALLFLLEDPDSATFEAMSESLLQQPNTIKMLEQLWQHANNEIALIRLDRLLHKARFNHFKQCLAQWKQNGASDIIEGAWLVASYYYPDLNLNEVTTLFADIIKDVFLKINEKQTPAEKVAVLNQVLFSQHRLHGEGKNNQNIFVNHVLQNKGGSDIALAIIYIGVAQKLCIPIFGVPLPHNFVLAYIDAETPDDIDVLRKDILFYINPFSGGIVFYDKDVRKFLHDQNIPFSPAFFQPSSNLTTMIILIDNIVALGKFQNKMEQFEDLQGLLNMLKS